MSQWLGLAAHMWNQKEILFLIKETLILCVCIQTYTVLSLPVSWGRLVPKLSEEELYWFPKRLYRFTLSAVVGECLPCPRPHKHELDYCTLILAILTDARWNPKVVLICISLVAKDVKHFLKCFSAIWDSIENSLFKSIPYFRHLVSRVLYVF